MALFLAGIMTDILITKEQFITLLDTTRELFGNTSKSKGFPTEILTDDGPHWHRGQAEKYARIIGFDDELRRINAYQNAVNQLTVVFRFATKYANHAANISDAMAEAKTAQAWGKIVLKEARLMSAEYYGISRRITQADGNIEKIEAVMKRAGNPATSRMMSNAIGDFQQLRHHQVLDRRGRPRPLTQVQTHLTIGKEPDASWAFPADPTAENVAAFVQENQTRAAASRAMAVEFEAAANGLAEQSAGFDKKKRSYTKKMEEAQYEYDVWTGMNRAEIEVLRRQLAPGQPKPLEQISLPHERTRLQRFAIWLLKKSLDR